MSERLTSDRSWVALSQKVIAEATLGRHDAGRAGFVQQLRMEADDRRGVAATTFVVAAVTTLTTTSGVRWLTFGRLPDQGPVRAVTPVGRAWRRTAAVRRC